MNSVANIGKTLPRHIQRTGPPQTAGDENGVIAVPEQVGNEKRGTDGRMEPEMETGTQEHIGVAVQNAVGQPEIGNTVPQHTAQLAFRLENGHLVAFPHQLHGSGQTSGTTADDGNLPSGGGRAGDFHAVQAGIGNIAFHIAPMHRVTLDAPDAMPLALTAVIAHNGADERQRVIFKQLFAGINQMAFPQQLDGTGNIGIYRTAFPAAGIFALQAAFRLDLKLQHFSLLFLVF